MKVSAVNNTGVRFFGLRPQNDIQLMSNPVDTFTRQAFTPLPYGLKAYNYTLPNGQRFVIVPKEGETVIQTYVNTGSMNEPDRVRGISHYIEHNLFNGSAGLEEGDFFKQVDKMGASTNASTDFAQTNYFISSNLLNKDDLENQLKIHASMLETPLFKDEKLDKEKGIVNSEINMILSRPQTIAENKTLKNLYGINSTSVDLIGGTTDNINNLTRQDVLDYYNKNYYPENMITVITGEVEPDETFKLASKYFTSKKQPAQQHRETLAPLQKTLREDIVSDKTSAAEIVIGFNAPTNTKDKVYLAALSHLLTAPAGRINEKLKPYGTSAATQKLKISTNATAALIQTRTTEQNSEKALQTLWDEIYNVQVNPPDAHEMQIIKKVLIRDYAQTFESSFSTNTAIGNVLLDNDLEYLTKYEQIVNSMTANDIVQTAQKYMDLNKAAVTVVHPGAAPVSFTGKQAIREDKVKEYNFANNVRLITNDITTRNANMGVYLECEAPINAKPAAYLALGNILNESSDKFHKNGIGLMFSADDKNIAAYMDFDAEDTAAAVRAFKEVLYAPRFEALEQTKTDIREQILTSEKDARKNLNTELFKGKFAGISDKEILESLDTVTIQDVAALHGALLANAQVKAVVSAPPETFNAVCAELGTMKPVKPAQYVLANTFTPTAQTKVITEADNKNQAKIIQAYIFRTNDNLKDETTLKLLNKILGSGPSSRLFMDLRERQELAYNVRSSISTVDNTGVVELSISTTTEAPDQTSYDNLQKSIEGFAKHIHALTTQKVSAEELKNAKMSLKNELLSRNETPAGKTASLLAKTPYGTSHKNKMLEMIDTITTDDIYNAANYIFAGKPTYSIVATENTLKHNAAYLTKLQSA